MKDALLPYFLDAISVLSGQPYQASWVEKAELALGAAVFLLIFSALFAFFYRRYFWDEKETRRLFFWTIALLASVVAAKFVIFYFWKGYIPDRVLFYGIPSPKFGGLVWFVPVAASIGLFLHWRARFNGWSAGKFLAALWCIFALFSVGVAGLREGAWSVYEPFTRSYWEYTGDIALIKNPAQFLGQYVELLPQRAVHSRTHPPGYSLTAYAFSRVSAHPLAISLFAVLLGGAAVFPLYFLLKAFFDEAATRRALAVFIFIPSVVMYSATSMETSLLFWSALALAVLVLGWRKSIAYSALGGLVAGAALFQNYLFLFFAPLFLLFFGREYRRTPSGQRALFLRACASSAGFAAFFLVLYFATGYSVLENFFAARAENSAWIQSNFASGLLYGVYLLVNLLAFSLGLGIANLIVLLRRMRLFFAARDAVIVAPFVLTLFFLLIGVFQGEVERIWLFLTPLFLFPFASLSEEKHATLVPAALSLSIFQIVVLQILFYTYW